MSKILSSIVRLTAVCVMAVVAVVGIFICCQGNVASRKAYLALGVDSVDCKAEGVVIGEYMTSLEKSGENRTHNVMLACSEIDGVTVEAGGIFSFNNVVGERTYARGYRDAKVIVNGEYVKGVGGGVCQVSTTLYNAWLLAGLDAPSVRSHTIPSSYAPLSRDATVSTGIDMLLVNQTDSAVTLSAHVQNGKLICRVLGRAGEYRYRLSTRIEREIESQDAPLVYAYVDDADRVGRIYYRGRKGYVSCLVREKLSGAEIESREVIRRDYYPPKSGQWVEYRLMPETDMIGRAS